MIKTIWSNLKANILNKQTLASVCRPGQLRYSSYLSGSKLVKRPNNGRNQSDSTHIHYIYIHPAKHTAYTPHQSPLFHHQPEEFWCLMPSHRDSWYTLVHIVCVHFGVFVLNDFLLARCCSGRTLANGFLNRPRQSRTPLIYHT